MEYFSAYLSCLSSIILLIYFCLKNLIAFFISNLHNLRATISYPLAISTSLAKAGASCQAKCANVFLLI